MAQVAFVAAMSVLSRVGAISGYWDRGRAPLLDEQGLWRRRDDAIAWGVARAPHVLLRADGENEYRDVSGAAGRADDSRRAGYGGTVFLTGARSERLGYVVDVRAPRPQIEPGGEIRVLIMTGVGCGAPFA